MFHIAHPASKCCVPSTKYHQVVITVKLSVHPPAIPDLSLQPELTDSLPVICGGYAGLGLLVKKGVGRNRLEGEGCTLTVVLTCILFRNTN